jgi:SRSO17 transposase
MIDELRSWGLEPPVILGDSAYGDITELRAGLEERGIDYVLEVKGDTSAFAQGIEPERPAYKGNGRPPTARYRQDPSSLKELALHAGKKAAVRSAGERAHAGRCTPAFSR